MLYYFHPDNLGYDTPDNNLLASEEPIAPKHERRIIGWRTIIDPNTLEVKRVPIRTPIL